ncbi:MAG: GNAT family N-acetyltransferase [Kiloniellales bacterium]
MAEAMLTAWVPGQPIELETENYYLRTLTPADVTPSYVAWAKDPDVMEGLNLPPRDISRERLQKYVQTFDGKSRFHLGIFDRKDDRFIGFYAVYTERAHKLGNINVVVGDRAYWGKKVVLETRAAIIDFLFDRIGCDKVWGMPVARNLPSVFNYQAQGYSCEGVLKKHRVSPRGERVDQYVFGLLKEDWKARKKGRGS